MAIPEHLGADHAPRTTAASLEAAVERARETDQTVLLRYSVRLPPTDPWLFLPSAEKFSGGWFAWHDGNRNTTYLSLGRIAHAEGGGEDRFTEARRFSERTAQRLFPCGEPEPAGLPMLLGGFAFMPTSGTGRWSGWSSADLVLPRVLLARIPTAGTTYGIVHQWIAPDCTPADELADLRDAIQGLVGIHQHDASHSAPRRSHLEEGRAHWCERVHAARGATHVGKLDKVVLARAVEYATSPETTFDTQATLWRLRREHPEAMTFAIHGPQDQKDGGTNAPFHTFVGATPEPLVAISRHEIHTRALAGTAPTGKTQQDRDAWAKKLLDSRKDFHEHALVADALRAALSEGCDEVHAPSRPQVLHLSQVSHLETPIRGHLREPGEILRWVERLHPSPAVGGWPRQPALDWLGREEAMERGWYAGPVGWTTSDGDGVFAVAIRSGLLARDRAVAFAGAGIVADSHPAAEWRETELKLKTLENALACTPDAAKTETSSASARRGAPV